jgi:hypothetical protein
MFRPGAVLGAAFISGKDDQTLEADWVMWENLAPKRQVSVDDGRLTLPALIPGATYCLATEDSKFRERGLRKTEFRVKAGETLTLPDFVVEP